MGQGIPSGYVLPTPQRAKLVGTLSIVFSLLVMIYIGIMFLTIVMTPMLTEWSQSMVKQGQANVGKQRTDRLAALKKEVAEAKTDKEKAELQGELTALELTPEPKVPDLKAMQDKMMTPGYFAWTCFDLLSGLTLNAAMLVSGVGLLRLKEWARKLANWTFGLKIARLLVLTMVTILVVIPMTSKMSAQMMEEMTQGRPSPFTMGDMAKFQAIFGTLASILGLVFGSIWPIVGMVLLTRPGTRAACRALSSKPAAPELDLS